MTGEPLLHLDGVTKHFARGTTAVEQIDLVIPRGGFVALLGPSGCGKSTLLRLAARLSQPTTGRVVWAEKKPEIGMVFQDATLMPWARIDDNVALALRLAGESRRAARLRAREMLARVGLHEFSEAYPSELSGGMKMRAALARALVTNPHALFLDEPFAALDEITRTKLNHDLLALWQAQRPAILFVTHSVYEAVFLAETVVVLSARPGRIAARITVAAPYPRPEGFRASAEYASRAHAVSEALAAAVGETGHEL